MHYQNHFPLSPDVVWLSSLIRKHCAKVVHQFGREVSETRRVALNKSTLASQCAAALTRAKNVIVLGSIESSSSHGSVRHAHDRKILDSIFDIVFPYSPRVVRWHRLGDWARNPSRPLLVESASVHDRDQMIASSFKLRASLLKNIRLKPDTPKPATSEKTGSSTSRPQPTPLVAKQLVVLLPRLAVPASIVWADFITCAVTNASS